MNEMNELRKVILIRYLALLSVILMGIFILINIKPKVNPWEPIALKIRESVSVELLQNELFQQLPKEEFNKFLDCTFKAQMEFLKKTGCEPKSETLELCLSQQGMDVFLEKQVPLCLKELNL